MLFKTVNCLVNPQFCNYARNDAFYYDERKSVETERCPSVTQKRKVRRREHANRPRAPNVLPIIPNEELVTSQGLRIDQHSVRSATHTACQNIPGVEAVEGFVEIIIGGDRGALESCTDKCSLAP